MKLSVAAVIPCFNAAPFLAEAIESVLRQSRPPDNVVVVDDCSTDDSAAVARRYSRHGVRLLQCPVNRGSGAARNLAIQEVETDLIAWLDADDLWEHHHLATVVPILERHPEAAVAFGGTRRFGTRSGDVLGYVPPGEPRHVFWEAFDDWIHIPTAAVCRRDALLEIGGFDETERCSVDYDLWLRLARRYPFVSTQRITTRWRWHPGQISSAPMRQIESVYRFRRGLWNQLHREGEHPLADQVAARCRELLQRDLRRSWYHRDLIAVRSLAGLISVIPHSPLAMRLRWTLQARLPEGFLLRYDELRRRCRLTA